MKPNKYIIYFEDSAKLAKNLSLMTNIPAYELEVIAYSFGEFSVRLPKLDDGGDVFFVVQNTGNPSETLIRILMALDTLQNYKPSRVNLIVPYLPFSRQDRQKSDNRALASRMVAKLFNTPFLSNIFAFDLHNDVITDYFKTPLYNLTMLDAFISYFSTLNLKDVVIVAPDHGRFKAARYVANAFSDASFLLIKKMRDDEGNVIITGIEGDTKGKTALIIEDIIDTGTTLVSAVNALIKQGVKDVYVAATHGVFSDNALEKIKALGVKKVIVTNTIPQKEVDDILDVLPIENQLKSIILD